MPRKVEPLNELVLRRRCGVSRFDPHRYTSKIHLPSNGPATMNEPPKAYWGSYTFQPGEADQLDRRPDVVSISRGELFLATCCDILRNGHGFVAATNAGTPSDAHGRWIPLFTYPCIEYIRQFDLAQKRIFEWGSGASTLYWMDRARSVVSVENNPQWFERVSQMKNDRVQLILDESDGFPFEIRKHDGLFDVIVVDGYGYRYDCAIEAIRKLAPGGMIILDNSDWHPMTAGALKKSGLIQVDFSGFKVTESHASTTSVFLHREFDFPTLDPIQPSYCVGAKRWLSGWDRPYSPQPTGSRPE